MKKMILLTTMALMFLFSVAHADSLDVEGKITGIKRYETHLWVEIDNPQAISGGANCYHNVSKYYFAFRNEDSDLLSMALSSYIADIPVKIMGVKEDVNGVNKEIAGICLLSSLEIRR